MDYKKITGRITGISVPLFGISWNPVDEEKRAARDLLHFLEDRRVLYYPNEREGADYCRQSVEEIRKELTRSLKSFTSAKGAAVVKQVQKFRRACRAFCDVIGRPGFDREDPVIQRSVLSQEISRLKKVAGPTVGQLSIAYGVDVDDELASIIPFRAA